MFVCVRASYSQSLPRPNTCIINIKYTQEIMQQCYHWWNKENEGKLIICYMIYQIVLCANSRYYMVAYIIIMHKKISCMQKNLK